MHTRCSLVTGVQTCALPICLRRQGGLARWIVYQPASTVHLPTHVRTTEQDPMSYELSHLRALEAEGIHIMREVAAEFERPVLLFSGGKDSIVMLELAIRAFAPAPIPFPVMHVDTGHNFPEVLEFRDRRLERAGARLIVASVQEAIDQGKVTERSGPRASRNQLQTVPLLDAIEEHGFDAVFGGARRDEAKARAKERVFSFRDRSEERRVGQECVIHGRSRG